MPLPTSSKERKQIPIFSGFLSYFPDAVAAVAAHSFQSNEQHNPGEPLHWAREKSTDQLDALARHLTELAMLGENPRLSVKIQLLKAIVWRAMAELQLTLEEWFRFSKKTLADGDVRKYGAVSDEYQQTGDMS